MSLISIDWHPSSGDLRKFGATWLVGFGVLGAAFWFGWPFHSNHGLGLGLWIGGGAAGLLGISGTRAALPVYWVWMAVSFVMGNIMNRVVLALFYYVFLTPSGLALRIFGRDRLALKKRDAATFWVDLDLPDDPERFQRQF